MTAGAVGLAMCLAALLAGQAATAQEFRLHAEPGGTFFVDDPQLDRFTPGLYFAVRPGLALGRVVALQWSYAALLAPAAEGYVDRGSAHFLLAGVRLRPFATLQQESKQLGGLFVDANAGYVRTGTLDRFGFDAGVGYTFQVASWFALGPALRYGQIVQPNDIPGRDSNDAQFLTLGLDLAFGPAHKSAEVAECPDAPACPDVAECPPEEVADDGLCPDYDRDGVCDDDDQCPTQIGPPATLGCPIDPCGGKPLVVLVQFDYNSASMPPLKDGTQTMDPVLDAVADAIAQDPSCRVCIVGHASEEGPNERNMELSHQRAVAVQKYMSARGLATTRMLTSGMGSDCPLIPHDTRVLNRRVEFHRLLEGESCPAGCFPTPAPAPATKAAAPAAKAAAK